MRQLKAVVAAALSSAALLAVSAPALADTAFGGDPSQPVSTSVNCGSATCTLYWTGAGGSDIAPIPASGGSGTVTSVTLPAMPNPGLMQAVVLTSSNTAGSEPGHPDYACCQVKELSSTFTVPANTVTTCRSSFTCPPPKSSTSASLATRRSVTESGSRSSPRTRRLPSC